MARIYKKTYPEALPENAEIITKDGKKCAKFNRKRKTIIAPLSKDGKKVLRNCYKWSITYRDENDILKTVLGYSDRKATEHYANELERTAEHIRSGYKPREHKHLNRFLEEHLEEFKTSLINKGTSQKQAQQVYNRVFRIIKECCFIKWSDIQAFEVQNFLSELRTDKKEKRGISIQTSNGYLQAFKAFCRWMHRENRTPENPVSHLQGLNAQIDRRHDRRALTVEECKLLLRVTATESKRFGMTGLERALLYRTALESGLRANELRTLTIINCELHNEQPKLIVKAGYSKHRKEDIQPILPDLAQALIKYTRNRCDEELLFKTMPAINRVAKMLRSDLKPTGIPYRDNTGKVVDFHALRHTYITNLTRSGLYPKIVMDLARHGNINLTFDRYSHTVISERAEALISLPTLTEDSDWIQEDNAKNVYNTKQKATRKTTRKIRKKYNPLQNKVVTTDVEQFAKPLFVGSNPTAACSFLPNTPESKDLQGPFFPSD